MTETKIKTIEKALKEINCDAFLVPHNDPHMLEYPPAHYERLKFLTDFNGSAGFAVVGSNGIASIFVDGRYTLQANSQVNKEIFQINDLNINNITKFLKKNKLLKLAYDPTVTSCNLYDTLSKNGFELCSLKENPIDLTWANRPDMPICDIDLFEEKYAGESYKEKLQRLCEKLSEEDIHYYLESAPDDICWLTNIRGRDVPFSPLVIAYALIDVEKQKTHLFVDKQKITKDYVRQYFDSQGIVIHPYDEVYEHIKQISKNKVIAFDFNKTTVMFRNITNKATAVKNIPSPIERLKSVKNATEIKNMKIAHIMDGASLCKFLYWIDKTATDNLDAIDEYKAAKKVTEFRKENPNFVFESFTPIAGFGSNGAVIHYKVNKESAKKFEKDNLFLIDSGGQYKYGTTDITRVAPIGEPNAEHKRCFTIVLKAHIALATVIFPKGTTGVKLDAITRNIMWKHGMDYAHGTGHGVGVFLNVHEGPQSISTGAAAIGEPLLPGMICSNEPGYYKKGEFGIRIENLAIVKESTKYNGFLELETISLAPIDRRLIDKSMLNEEEINWLNNYHQRILKELSNELSKDQSLTAKETSSWLHMMCSPI